MGKSGYHERVELHTSDLIPSKKRGIQAGIAEESVVKIYHELTDSFGNPLKSSKTFNLKDKEAQEAIQLKKGAPAYLQKNFNDIMQ